MSTEKRKYELKARRASRDRTRQRIVEATSQLHEEVGPARTTVAEIARRAGVQRLTVYTHFPTDAELIAACGAHWQARHPPPDPTPFPGSNDAADGLRAALRAFYVWYRDNEAMVANIRRDRHFLPAMDEALKSSWDRDLRLLAIALSAAFGPTDAARPVTAAVALALEFWTWQRLAQEGLDVDAAAELMVTCVAAVAGRST
jgi:AcrR family transcriptional regulator